MQALKDWLMKNMVMVSWGDFDGLEDLNLAELYQLQGLVMGAIAEKQMEKMKEIEEGME